MDDLVSSHRYSIHENKVSIQAVLQVYTLHIVGTGQKEKQKQKQKRKLGIEMWLSFLDANWFSYAASPRLFGTVGTDVSRLCIPTW